MTAYYMGYHISPQFKNPIQNILTTLRVYTSSIHTGRLTSDSIKAEAFHHVPSLQWLPLSSSYSNYPFPSWSATVQ